MVGQQRKDGQTQRIEENEIMGFTISLKPSGFDLMQNFDLPPLPLHLQNASMTAYTKPLKRHLAPPFLTYAHFLMRLSSRQPSNPHKTTMEPQPAPVTFFLSLLSSKAANGPAITHLHIWRHRRLFLQTLTTATTCASFDHRATSRI